MGGIAIQNVKKSLFKAFGSYTKIVPKFHIIPYVLLLGALGLLDLVLRALNLSSLSFPLFSLASQLTGLVADSADPLGFYVNCKTNKQKKPFQFIHERKAV